MKFSWLILGTLFAGGCSSKPEPAPEPTAAPIVIPTIVPTPTTSPFLQMPTPTSATPEPVFGNAADSPLPAIENSAQAADEAKRKEVEDLRLEMRLLQNQRANAEQRKADFGASHPDARAEERALGASSQNDARMAQYNQQLDEIDSQLRNKQRKIDDLMMSR